MTISVAIRIKGQAAGLPYQATAGEAITATLDSVANVNSVQWSVAAGDDLVAAASYTLVASGVKGENVAFNASATVGTALLLQAVVNADPTLYARAKVYVPAANGLETGADGEGYEGDATHGTTGIQNAAIRASGVGVAVPVTRVITATTPIRIDGGASADLSADRTLSILAASGAVAGSMSAAHYTLVAGATATPTASTIAKWGASIDMGAALLYDSAGGTVPATGFINVGATSTIVAGHSASGTATRLLLRWAAAKLFVGEEADEMQLDAVTAAHLGVSGSKAIYVTASGIQIFGAGSVDFASGVGVIGLASAGTEPTGNPAAGKAVAWLYGGALKTRGPKGLVSTLARDADATQALQVDDKWWRTAQTTDVAAAVATYADALPVNSQFALELNVVGVQHGTDTRCHFKIISGGGRAGGGLTVDATDVQTIFDAIGVSGVPTVTNAANAPQLNMLGKAATTIDWTSFGTIRIVGPTP